MTKFTTKYFLGFAISCILIWVISAIFSDSPEPKIFSKELGRYILVPGTVHQHRSEGWASTFCGQYGIHGIENVCAVQGAKILIWGDSYVEAWQVDDSEKMSQQLTMMFKEGAKTITALSIGFSGQSVADYYYQIPRYEMLIEDIEYHIIFIGSIADVLPNNQDSHYARFVHNNDYNLIDFLPLFSQQVQEIYKVVVATRAFFISSLMNRLPNDLRFALGPVDKTDYTVAVNEMSGVDLEEAWAFLLKSLNRQTNKPVVFIYAPHVPRIEANAIVYHDTQADYVDVFRKKCLEHEVYFIDMTAEFLDNYQNEQSFPRGFQNSRPGDGHLNAIGHKLVAKSIYRFIERHALLKTLCGTPDDHQVVCGNP